MAKYDKRRQGLVKDVSLETSFETAVIYEGYMPVYEETLMFPSTQEASSP
jgi:hypothetical protein